MHIAFVTHRYPPQRGGVETHVERIATRLVARGHEVTVVSADRGDSGHPRERRDGVHVRRVRSVAPGDAIHFAPGVCSVSRRVAREADVVHLHNYHSLPFTIAAFCVTDTPLVATPHYHAGSDDPVRDRLLSVLRPLGRRAFARVERTIAVGEWEAGRLRATFDVSPTVVPNGVVRERFADAKPERRDRPYLLTVGRLESYKRVADAITALPALPDHELCVAGSGPARDDLETVARETGVADRVTFLGYVADDRLPGLYAGADAYLSVSTHEAFGLTVAEAIAAGTPVVVRATRGLTDWTSHTGVVGVEPPTRPHDSTDIDASDSTDANARDSTATDASEPTGADARGSTDTDVSESATTDSVAAAADNALPPKRVARAVRAAIEGPEPDPTSVPTWDEVADRLLRVYRGVVRDRDS